MLTRIVTGGDILDIICVWQPNPTYSHLMTYRLQIMMNIQIVQPNTDYRTSATVYSVIQVFVISYKAYELHLETFATFQRTNQSYPRQESNLRPNQLSSYKAVALPLSYEGLFSLIQLIFQFIEVGY